MVREDNSVENLSKSEQKGKIIMQEIRNADNKLVAMFNPKSCSIEIVIKGCKTTILVTPDGKTKITNSKTA